MFHYKASILGYLQFSNFSGWFPYFVIFPLFSHVFRRFFVGERIIFLAELQRQACGNVVYGYGGEVSLQCRSVSYF
jgi:hypothetical protein